MAIIVPNKHPTINLDYRIALVSEYPGKHEEEKGEPFVGTSGDVLNALLTNKQILRQACFLGNICQVKTPASKEGQLSPFDTWEIDGVPSTTYLQQGYEALKTDLDKFNPNITVLLGNAALRAAGVNVKVHSMRGSLFVCRDSASPFFGRKCISSFNPAYVYRDFTETPLLDFDLGRAKEESLSPTLVLPQRTIHVDLSYGEILDHLHAIKPGSTISVDIEGTPESGIKCIGIALRPDYAFVYWPSDFTGLESQTLWHALGMVFADRSTRKILQNSLFDNFALAHCFGMPIYNVWWDTMLSGWECFPELEKGLDTQTSIWTREPYYKFERKIPDKRTHAIYCGKDCCVTYEIAKAQEAYMSKEQKEHFHFNMSLLDPLLYMEHRGIRYDAEGAKQTLDSKVLPHMEALNEKLDKIFFEKTKIAKHINPRSSGGDNSIAKILYDHLKYPRQYKKERGRKTDKETADKDSLLTLAKDEPDDSFIKLLLEYRAYESQRKQLVIGADPDGRIRASYNLVGTDTGRMACYGSPTGSGSNLQTIMHEFRHLYRADNGYDFFKCDLSGADGWTVAAWCKHFGDSTMLDDYLFGLDFKPAKVLMLLYLGGPAVNTRSRDQLFEEMKSLNTKEGWLYPACKAVQHGGNYGMKPNKVSDTIKTRSYRETGKAVYVDAKKCKALQDMFLNIRYRGVKDWQEKYVQKQLKTSMSLPCASGHVRHFFGLAHVHETITSAYSHEPQANTTYATNLAVRNLWYDPENRLGHYFDPATLQEARQKLEAAGGTPALLYILDIGRAFKDPTKGYIHESLKNKPLIEPLHQVHDELSGQWPTPLREWARKKVPSYFQNDLQIAHQTIRIPFEGKFGDSWGTCNTKF